MKKFEKKKLLVLGSNVGATDIVSYAKENGAYTIVADNLSPNKSPAKLLSDENLLISTADTGALGKVIQEREINGVLAGISEFNLLQAMALSEKHNKPFYCSTEQWGLVEKKDNFRKLCKKHQVPTPKTYYTGTKIPEALWSEIQYPAVIKPVDACASMGVYICYSEKELRSHEEDAIKASGCGHIILEEFAHGDEFTAHYTIANGVVTLSCVDNRYPVSVHGGQVTTVPVARVYPCLYMNEYCKQVNPSMLDLCAGIGITNGILFIQGIYDCSKNRFYIFEAGLRCAGEAPYRFIDKINGVNAMHVLVDHALSAEVAFDSASEDPTLKGKCCGIVSFVTKGGTVGDIIGLENAVAATPSVIEYENRYPVGSETPNGDTLRQLMIRFIMICESREQMAKDVKYLNENISVLDTNGQNMVLKLEPERILNDFQESMA